MSRNVEAYASLEEMERKAGVSRKEVLTEAVRRGLKNAGVDLDAEKERELAAWQEKVKVAGKAFMAAHPPTDEANPYLVTPANERLMLDFINNDPSLDAAKSSSFEVAYLELRDKLEMPVRRTRTAPVGPKIIYGVRIAHDWDKDMTAEQMRRALENPAIAAALNALPPNKRK
jgi:hypothetical protein